MTGISMHKKELQTRNLQLFLNVVVKGDFCHSSCYPMVLGANFAMCHVPCIPLVVKGCLRFSGCLGSSSGLINASVIISFRESLEPLVPLEPWDPLHQMTKLARGTNQKSPSFGRGKGRKRSDTSQGIARCSGFFASVTCPFGVLH